MSELGPRAREILRSGREQIRPTDADRERVESALRDRLGAALLPTSQASPTIRPRWPFVGSLVVGAGLIGGAVLFSSRRPPVETSAPREVATAVTETSAKAPTTTAAELTSANSESSAEASRPAALVSAERPTPSTRPAEDRLAQEVALLARATSDLHSGRPTDALKVLDEYQRRFPKGLLTEERRAARAQALCALGRQSEASSELSRLPAQSLAAARAKQVCDASSALKK